MKEIRLIDFNIYFKSTTDHNLSFDFLAYDLTRWNDDETIRLVTQYFQKLFIRFFIVLERKIQKGQVFYERAYL